MLHYNGLERLTSYKHSSLFGKFVSCEEKKVLGIWSQISNNRLAPNYRQLNDETKAKFSTLEVAVLRCKTLTKLAVLNLDHGRSAI
jgi:hypothetical protein